MSLSLSKQSLFSLIILWAKLIISYSVYFEPTLLTLDPFLTISLWPFLPIIMLKPVLCPRLIQASSTCLLVIKITLPSYSWLYKSYSPIINAVSESDLSLEFCLSYISRKWLSVKEKGFLDNHHLNSMSAWLDNDFI
jgi:hypothetical protein